MNNYTKLIIFILILVIGVTSAIVYLSLPLLTGKTYILDTRPVDPFDILRGQYITIGYEIGIISDGNLDEEDIGKTVYVVLEEDEEGIARPGETSFTKPDEDFIKGKIKSFRGDSASIEYGIEQFFFERGAKFSMRDITVEVKIDSSGQARISEILQAGEPLKIKYKDVGFTS